MTKEEGKELLSKLAKQLDIELNDKQLRLFMQYYDLLIEKNKVMNLTAITELEEVIVKHFIDSLSIATMFDMNEEINVLDLGSGAGFPGLPLKIAFPNINLIMVDSLRKRVDFLNDTSIRLGLTHAEAIHMRAEDAARIVDLRQNFDLVVSRAVANLATLSEYCMPFVCDGGSFVCYKAGDVDDELLSAKKAIKTLSGEVVEVNKFTLPESDIERSLIRIKVNGKINNKYPRKSGLPGKEPIK